MNKKDIATIRKQFKIDNDLLSIRSIYNVYVQKETGDIYHAENQNFSLLDEDTQELFLNNFKKVLTGQLDTKLFELKFKREAEETTQELLFSSLGENGMDDFEDNMFELVEKMYENKTYDFDTVVTFVTGKFRAPARQKEVAYGEEKEEIDFLQDFILCSVNKTSTPKTELIFDYIEKAFRPSTNVDPVINLTSPLQGFLFPTFINGMANVNHILYRSKKANEPDIIFIEDVLECEGTVTGADDKDSFELIVNHITDSKVNAETISNMYEELGKVVEAQKEMDEDEEPTIDYHDVENILKTSGVENIDAEKVKKAFTTIVADEQHEFKANHLVPKKLSIETENTKISLDPNDLRHIKYVVYNGRRCLLIEIRDDVNVEGFLLENS